MKGKGTLVLAALILIISFSTNLELNSPIDVKVSNGYPVHNLNTGLNYTTIQEAINANETLNGDTIFVEEGIYNEQLVVNKSITLLGQNKLNTILDGDLIPIVVNVTADNVNIHGFTVRNAQGDFYGGGIYIGSNNNNVSHNIILNNRCNGILLEASFNNTVTNNEISLSRFFGIWIRYSTNTSIYKNLIFLNQDTGLFASGSSGNNISGNTVFSNKYMGIYLMASHNSVISNNYAFNNTHGIYLTGCHNSSICNNSVALSPARMPTSSGSGVYLGECSNCTVTRNDISNQSCGIYIVGSQNNTASRNMIFNNTKGVGSALFSNNNTISENMFITNEIALELRCDGDNSIYWNNFLQNKETPTVFYKNEWNKFFEGNYWSNYNGNDLNNDGIGDSPFLVPINNMDSHPLMGMFSSFNTPIGEYVNVISNSSIDDFDYADSNNTITIYVSNLTLSQAYGFIRIAIPHVLITEPYNITVNGVNPTYWNYTIYDDGTHRWIYFEYEHSMLEITIIPEFPSLIILPLLMIITLLSSVVYKKRINKTRTNE